MKCNYCGFEHEEDLTFCPRCGKQLFAETLSLNPMSDRVFGIFTDGLFLVICILMSAAAVLNLTHGGLPVFEILFTIFLWLCFAQGKKGFIDHSHIRSISGTVFAYYILNFVLAGTIALGGFALSALISLIQGSPEIFEGLMSEIDLTGIEGLEVLSGYANILGGAIIILFLIIATAVILINIFGVRKIHKLIQSLYKSVEYNENRIVFAKAARTWLVVLGALSLVGALLSYTSLTALDIIAEVCIALCGIFAGVLISKHLSFE